MAKISSIRQIAFQFPGGTAQEDVTINPSYDPSRTVVIATFRRNANENNYDHLLIQKLDANTIRIRSTSNLNSGGEIILQLIEFSEGITVQDVVGPDNIYNINQVDLSQSFLVGLGSLNPTGKDNESEKSAMFRFIGDTQIEIQANHSNDCSVQVVEWEGCSASQYAFAPAGSQQSQLQFDVGISQVDPTKSCFFSSFFSPNVEDTGAIAGTLEFIVEPDGTSVTARINRNRTGNIEASQITFFVVEFDDGTLCDANEGTATNGNTVASLSYPDFGLPTIPDEFFIMPASISGLNLARYSSGGSEEGDQVHGTALKPAGSGSDILCECNNGSTNVTWRLQYIRPSPTGVPPPTPDDAYPGLTASVITDILNSIFYTQPWDDASASDQQKALNAASKAIDHLNYMGVRTDANQVNQFPRNGDLLVPNQIHTAIVHEAIMLLDGMDPQFEHQNQAIISDGYANVRSTHDHSSTRDHILAGIMSIHAWRYLQPFLRRPGDRDIFRA